MHDTNLRFVSAKADDEPVKALGIGIEVVEFQKEICRRYGEQICVLKFYKL